MGALHRGMISAAVAAFFCVLPAAAQDLPSQARKMANPAGGPAMSARDRMRRNFEVGSRMTGIPEFVQALHRGDARAAKRIFVAHGGSDDQVIIVPAPRRSPLTGYNLSDPLPADAPIGLFSCDFWTVVPWGPNGWKAVCWGFNTKGEFGSVHEF